MVAFPIKKYSQNLSSISFSHRGNVTRMTMAELQKELSLLPNEQQDTLAAYLTMLRKSRDPNWEKTLSTRMSDTNSAHWINLDQVAQG